MVKLRFFMFCVSHLWRSKAPKKESKMNRFTTKQSLDGVIFPIFWGEGILLISSNPTILSLLFPTIFSNPIVPHPWFPRPPWSTYGPPSRIFQERYSESELRKALNDSITERKIDAMKFGAPRCSQRSLIDGMGTAGNWIGLTIPTLPKRLGWLIMLIHPEMYINIIYIYIYIIMYYVCII